MFNFSPDQKNPTSSFVALLIAAGLMYGIRVGYFHDSILWINAGIIQGFLSAITPILIIWGAILLFQTMENSFALQTIKDALNNISQNKVAQIMIIGWAFIFFVEGVSGFGTPIALAAPLLVGLGMKPLQTIIFCLIMDTFPVSFGAIGTPTWFGFSALNLNHEMLLQIGQKTAWMHFIAAFIIAIWALRMLISWEDGKKNYKYIVLSLLSCLVPYLIFAHINTELPTLIGGAIGLGFSILFAKFGIGLEKQKEKKVKKIKKGVLLKALFPLASTVCILLITRVDAWGIKDFLKSTVPFIQWGNGEFSISGVISWKNILGTDLSWTHETLYVPSFIPFLFVVLCSFWVLGMTKEQRKKTFLESFHRMKKPMWTLFAALIFVKIFLVGENAPAIFLGKTLAEILGKSWIFFAPFLGALGAFFSGSNTVSNLTFAGVQESAALASQLNKTTILALQNVGGAAGNMVSISNIIAGCSVLGLVNQEGKILAKTFFPLIVYCIIAGIMALFL